MGQRRPRRPDESPSSPQSELAELRARYRRELPEKIRAVKEAAAVLGKVPDPQALEALHLLTHRLVGSAAIYGFGATSQAAAALEAVVVEALYSPAAASDLWAQRMQTLVAALERSAGD